MHVRLFYSDGNIIDGWTIQDELPVVITNKELLLDGRFNA